MASQVILLITLAAFLSTGIVLADDSPLLSGSKMEIEAALSKADVVFVARITAIGDADIKAKGVLSYYGVQIRLLRSLKGSLDPNPTFTLYFIGTPSYRETPPDMGSSYIFFATRNNEKQSDPYIVLKLLPATGDSIAKVEKLISN